MRFQDALSFKSKTILFTVIKLKKKKIHTENFYTFCSQVAQYIKFEIPVLDSFVEKLKEEEEREITKLTRK